MTKIIKEIPSGIIDGVNKEFTFNYSISQFDDLWMDGAIYTTFSINGKIVTLEDAPNSSIFGDYLTNDTITEDIEQFISKEIPTGNVDGINKEFNLTYNPKIIDDVWMDGEVYLSYKVDGKKIILLDSPKNNIFIDYFTTPKEKLPNFQEIRKEAPLGKIDGLNNTFTFKHIIYEMEDLWIDGAISKDFYIDGRSIVTSFAPKYSIFADYIPKVVKQPRNSDITLGDMMANVYWQLAQNPNNINFTSQIVTQKINEISNAIWKGNLINLLNPNEIIKSGNLYFREGARVYKNSLCVRIQEDLKPGQIELKIPTFGLNNSGFLEIGGEIIEYVQLKENLVVLTRGVSNIYLSGTLAFQLHELPLDYSRINKLTLVCNDKELPYDKGINTYKVVYDVESNKKFLKIHNLTYRYSLKLDYTRKYQKLTDTNEYCPYPEDYGISVISTLVAGSLAYTNNLQSGELLNTGYQNLKQMYSYFNSELENIKQKLTPKSYNFNSIRFGRWL